MKVMQSADETKDRWHASAWKTMYFIVAATDAASSKASAGVAPSVVPRGGVQEQACFGSRLGWRFRPWS